MLERGFSETRRYDLWVLTERKRPMEVNDG